MERGVRLLMQVRSAKPGESQNLTALCVRSKAHWGYDAAFMKLSAAALPEGDTADLDALFVDPPAIGGGAGRALFEAAVTLARRQGARRMTILADPNAAAFYERMGARYLRHAPSDAIPGRTLPFYEYDLQSGTVS
jgi:GNAT superfamily N-acetyltransferase